MVLFAGACKRSPMPPSPGPSAHSARLAVSGSPPASAPVASVAAPSCADWTVNDRGATGSLEHWCQHFGPCPESLQQAVTGATGRFPTIETRGTYRTFHSGFLGGRAYTFELDRLVGARIWNDGPFGACAERVAVTYTAGREAPSSQPSSSCGVVPGRDYANGAPCRCNVKARTPKLVNGNQGPLLRTSLECLYEVGVAAYLCHPTLRDQREDIELQTKAVGQPFRASERQECGDTVIISPFRGASAACRYDAAGTLTGLRWGKRYVSEGLATCSKVN